MRKLLILLGISLVVLSCKKDVTVPNSGIYRGSFFEIENGGDTLASGVVYIAMWEKTLRFEMKGDSVTNAPANQYGSYLVDNANSMQFINESGFATQYDIDHYLDTVYNYEFDNTNFKFWQTWGGKTYEYNLIRD